MSFRKRKLHYSASPGIRSPDGLYYGNLRGPQGLTPKSTIAYYTTTFGNEK